MGAGQVGNQILGGPFAMGECVALNGLEQIEHAPRGRPAAGAAFGVKRQGLDPFALHCRSQLAFQQRLDQQGEEVHREQRLDTVDGLQVHRRHLEVGLQLGKPFFDGGLPLVGFQQFQFGKFHDVGDQGKDAVAFGVFGHSEGIDAPGQVEPGGHFSHIGSFFGGASTTSLTKRFHFLPFNFGDDPRLGSAGGKNLGYCLGHLALLTVASARRLKLVSQRGQFLQGPFDPRKTRDGVLLGLPLAVIPDQPIAFGARGGLVARRVAIDHFAVLVRLLPQESPSDLARHDHGAEGRIFATRLGQNRKEPTLTLVQVGHVLAGGQLRIGHVEEVASTGQLAEQVPGVAMGDIVGDVAAGSAKVERHTAIGRDRENEQQLLQIRPMIFVVAESDGQRRPSKHLLLQGRIEVGPEEGHRGRVVVQFVQAEAELLDDVCGHAQDQRRHIGSKQLVPALHGRR